MILSPEQASQRLSSSANLANRFADRESYYYNPPGVLTTPMKHAGSINGEARNLNTVEATLIATLARAGDHQGKIAEEFDVSQQAVSRLKLQGGKRVDEEAVERSLGKVEDLALDRLMSSLGFMTDDKLSASKATELSSIASNMSKVHANLRGNGNQNNQPNVVVQIFRPEIKQESSFKTIDV